MSDGVSRKVLVAAAKSWSGMLLVTLLSSAHAAAEIRPFVLDSGTYSYLPSPWFFNQHDCPWEKGCEFDIEGVLTLNVDEKVMSVTIESADLILVGNEDLVSNPIFESAPITGGSVAALLSRYEFVRDKAAPAGSIFVDEPFEVGLEPSAMYLHGIYDHRPADGDGYIFDITGVETWIGDSNLDGEFNSTDFVAVFKAGLYESDSGGATWMTGDWDGDGRFDSSDFVLAFSDGGYEQGPISVVPEPVNVPLLVACLLLGFMRLRHPS